jgi:DNA-directed RNA polymerase
MKMIVKLFMLWAITTLLPTYANDFELPKYTRIQLSNGLTLLLMEQHEVPMIDINIRVNAGAIHSNIEGLPSVVATALTFDAGPFTKSQLNEQIEFLGASLNSSANKEQTTITASFLSKDVNKVLPIIAAMLQKPHFNPDELTKYLTRYQSKIVQRKESPKQVIMDYFDRAIFQEHPYARSNYANESSLKQISPAAVTAFYQQFYQPQNCIIAIAGDFNSNKMLSNIKTHFAQWKNNEKMHLTTIKPPKPLVQKSVVWIIDKPDATETTFMIGGQGVSRNAPEYVTLELINTILGGRFTSWLNSALRINSGLTYGAHSRFSYFSQGGRFYISTFTQNKSSEQAIDLALATYQKLWQQNKLDATTLASGKAYMKGLFPFEYESTANLANTLADIESYKLSPDFINGFNKKIDSISIGKIEKIIQQYFPKDNLQFVLIGQAQLLKKFASKYGEVKILSLQ